MSRIFRLFLSRVVVYPDGLRATRLRHLFCPGYSALKQKDNDRDFSHNFFFPLWLKHYIFFHSLYHYFVPFYQHKNPLKKFLKNRFVRTRNICQSDGSQGSVCFIEIFIIFSQTHQLLTVPKDKLPEKSFTIIVALGIPRVLHPPAARQLNVPGGYLL